MLLSFNTAFFNESHIWTEYAMETGGVLIFNNQKEQPDTKKHVEYYKLRCLEKKCVVVESVLSVKEFINVFIYEPEIIKLSYPEKEAILRHKDCIFMISAGATTFNCTQGNETGSLGSHITLHYKQHGIFNY